MRAQLADCRFKNLRDIQRTANSLRDAVDQSGAINLLRQSFFGMSTFTNVPGNALDSEGLPIHIDQARADFEGDADTRLGKYFQIINCRSLIYFLARKHLPGGLCRLRRQYVGNIHPQRFFPTVAGYALS